MRRITIRPQFGFGQTAFSMGGVSVTNEMVLVPFIFGVEAVFYDASKWYGRALAVGSLFALVFGVIANLNFQFATMTAFDLIVILIMLAGGIVLIFRSLRTSGTLTGL